MNEFGTFAMETWRRLAPSAFAEIKDPNQHFSTLGKQAEDAWAALMEQMAHETPRQSDYLAEVGRLNQIRQSAREIIQQEWCMPPTELLEDEDDDQPDAWQQEIFDTLMAINLGDTTEDGEPLVPEVVVHPTGWQE